MVYVFPVPAEASISTTLFNGVEIGLRAVVFFIIFVKYIIGNKKSHLNLLYMTFSGFSKSLKPRDFS